MVVLALLGLLALSGCKAESAKGDEAAPTEVPAVAPSMPATVSDPRATAILRGFERRDANRDGFISVAENAAAEAQIFHAFDADQDGTLTPQELDAARVALGLTTLPSSQDLIRDADQDSDGKLTLAEWIAHEGEAFNAADTDHDGRLSRAEFAAQPRLEAPAPNAKPAVEAESTAGAG